MRMTLTDRRMAASRLAKLLDGMMAMSDRDLMAMTRVWVPVTPEDAPRELCFKIVVMSFVDRYLVEGRA